MKMGKTVKNTEAREVLRQVVQAFLQWDHNVYTAERPEDDQQDLLWRRLQRSVFEASRLFPARSLPQAALRRCGLAAEIVQ